MSNVFALDEKQDRRGLVYGSEHPTLAAERAAKVAKESGDAFASLCAEKGISVHVQLLINDMSNSSAKNWRALGAKIGYDIFGSSRYVDVSEYRNASEISGLNPLGVEL